MVTILDRMLFWAFLRSYIFVGVSFISLFVVIDLFTHLDAYVNRPGGWWAILQHIGQYYLVRLPQMFDFLAEAITLMAATFTVAWMLRNNELLPQLSAGIPTRRVIRPVLVGSVITLLLPPLNQEFVIPELADQLMTSRDDPEGAKAQVLLGAFDSSGIHLEGQAGYRKDKRIEWLYVTFPEHSPGGMIHLVAAEAFYIPPGDGPLTGGWLLIKATPDSFTGPTPMHLTVLGPGRFFLKVETANFDAVNRGNTWYVHAATSRLYELLTQSEGRRQEKMAVLFHTRLTRPIVGTLLVLLGVSVILWNPQRHVVLSAGLCVVIGAGFYVCLLGCKALGEADYITAPLAAWLPVLLYGPMAVVAYDAMHT